MATATIEGLRTLSPIPEQGKRFLSVNVALVDVGEVWQIARELGFSPTLVQIPYRSKTEVHALLWQGAIAETPSDWDEKVNYLADQVNTVAIRCTAGAWTQAA